MSKTEDRPAEAPADLGTFVGKSVPRKEDDRLVRGEGVFSDDVRRHGMGYVHFVRSPYAHARIVSVDVSKAEALEGVYGTLTPDEVVARTSSFPKTAPGAANRATDYCLAVGKVRHIGEPVAAVVAATRELARDAADLVEVEYEPLEALVDARHALDDDAPVVHEEVGSNLVWADAFHWGDPDGALNAADRVLRIKELHFHRFSSTPLECAAAVVEYDAGADEYTLHCNQQVPGRSASWMGPALGTSADKFRFVTRDIGGGFGNKTMLHPYLTSCCLLARKLRRPVNWTEWRSDQHAANAHGNERWFEDVEVAVMNDGTLLGFKARAIDDCGAHARYEPMGAIIWSQVAPACYGWRNIHVDFSQVFTNKSPVGANRGYSRMQHIWLIERIIDLVAHELGLDPVEVRKRNYIRAEQMPYVTPNGCVYDSGDYARSLDMALELIDYDSARERQASATGKLVGVGIGSTLDSGTNNTAQARIANPAARSSGNSEVATVKLDLLGEIVASLGTTPQGQGHETTSAQVIADILGVTPDDVRVRSGHDTYWNSHSGYSGTTASQFAVTGLGAIKGASEKLAAEIRLVAAWALDAEPDDVVLASGRASVGERALTFGECAAFLNANIAALPSELDDVTLNCRFVYRAPFELPDAERKMGNLALTYASQVHACVIEIDPETGVVEIVDYAAVDDCGVRINPRIVDGQVHGAIAHSLGAVFSETFTYDEDGQLLTPNFYDYHVPHALDMPPLKMASIESPSPFAPLGAKGMGEGGGGAVHTVCAAIQDALRHAGLQAVVHDSHNPPERVWELIRNPQASAALVEVETR
jgi:CO/xanthine dehydrogenase Mo-binding subunit